MSPARESVPDRPPTPEPSVDLRSPQSGNLICELFFFCQKFLIDEIILTGVVLLPKPFFFLKINSISLQQFH